MEPALREHIKLSIDAAARKRVGLPASVVRRSAPQPRMNSGQRWPDSSIVAALKQCAADLDVPYASLTIPQYRRWRAGDKYRGPSDRALVKRVKSLSPQPKGMLS